MPKPEDNRKFWMVWSVGDKLFNDWTNKYPSRQKAEDVAEAHAIKYGVTFYVMEAMCAIEREVLYHPLIDPLVIKARAREYDNIEE